MNAFFKTKKDREVEDGTAFIRNGGMVLKKLIGFCNGKCNPIRGFSAEELMRATNSYEASQVLLKTKRFKLYKGFLQDRPILVKKYVENLELLSLAINEIPFASHMSVHKNVLKLSGSRLKTEIPILVFESVKHGTLHDHLYSLNDAHFQPLLWKHRLKIAVDIANVVAYLHNAFPKPIIHRQVKPRNILLDDHYVAKLSDFSLSISIPEGQSHVKDVLAGTPGFISPEYAFTGFFNEKHDVFSFGVCQLVLLTGKKVYDAFRNDTGDEVEYFVVKYVKKNIEDNLFNEIVDPIIVGEGPWPGKDQQLQSFAALALRCVCEAADDRPAIIDVAKELRQIYLSGISPI